jgi:hypothetical protein
MKQGTKLHDFREKTVGLEKNSIICSRSKKPEQAQFFTR